MRNAHPFPAKLTTIVIIAAQIAIQTLHGVAAPLVASELCLYACVSVNFLSISRCLSLSLTCALAYFAAAAANAAAAAASGANAALTLPFLCRSAALAACCRRRRRSLLLTLCESELSQTIMVSKRVELFSGTISARLELNN